MPCCFCASEHGKPELPEQLRSQTGVWVEQWSGVWDEP